jgi:hypothetical protein
MPNLGMEKMFLNLRWHEEYNYNRLSVSVSPSDGDQRSVTAKRSVIQTTSAQFSTKVKLVG